MPAQLLGRRLLFARVWCTLAGLNSRVNPKAWNRFQARFSGFAHRIGSLAHPLFQFALSHRGVRLPQVSCFETCAHGACAHGAFDRGSRLRMAWRRDKQDPGDHRRTGRTAGGRTTDLSGHFQWRTVCCHAKRAATIANTRSKPRVRATAARGALCVVGRRRRHRPVGTPQTTMRAFAASCHEPRIGQDMYWRGAWTHLTMKC
jgi:hypothetical protein